MFLMQHSWAFGVTGLKRCLAAKAPALKALPSALFEGAADADEDDDLDMLIIDPGSTADWAEAFAWADAVVGHLCDNEDVKDSILMVLLMPVVRLTFPSQCLSSR